MPTEPRGGPRLFWVNLTLTLLVMVTLISGWVPPAVVFMTGTALALIVSESAKLEPVIVVGMPLWIERGLFNAAIVVHRGRILGVVPKSYLP